MIMLEEDEVLIIKEFTPCSELTGMTIKRFREYSGLLQSPETASRRFNWGR
jgi:hypothetical protein